MATNGSSTRLEQLALAVASGSTIKSAAEQTGNSERNAYRLSASDEFRQRVNEIRSEVAAATVGKLTQAASDAADTLIELLDVRQEPSIRLQASKAILAAVGPISELGELRARLDAIEHNNQPRMKVVK